MAAKPLTTEAIALTEKKMDMTLDDIIKMSKNNTSKTTTPRVSNRSQNFLNNGAQEKTSKVERFMDSRSSMRQGVLAQRRSKFKGNQFPLATEAARKAAVAPIPKEIEGRKGFDMKVTGKVACMSLVCWSQHAVVSCGILDHDCSCKLASESCRGLQMMFSIGKKVFMLWYQNWSAVSERVGDSLVQRKATNGSFTVKPKPQVNAVPKQRPQTLDAMFANMKELEDEGFVSTEQWWKTKWRWPAAKTAVGKRSIWRQLMKQIRDISCGITNCVRHSLCLLFYFQVEVLGELYHITRGYMFS
ncbi:hypothetical protein Acr_00g0040910 [Actinidia rufa]|uniref:Uncharacterized protein n=1 Tax=Actinidia rufa TaxID=165716 RepID=A0A7J0DHV5_9ERIC|nr:hypothetical protein Acr_00g0040910 [Actinidia rufa]